MTFLRWLFSIKFHFYPTDQICSLMLELRECKNGKSRPKLAKGFVRALPGEGGGGARNSFDPQEVTSRVEWCVAVQVHDQEPALPVNVGAWKTCYLSVTSRVDVWLYKSMAKNQHYRLVWGAWKTCYLSLMDRSPHELMYRCTSPWPRTSTTG